MGTAFGLSEDDIVIVLRNHSTRVTNSNGQSFEAMAEDLFADLDHDAVEGAALDAGCELDVQTDAAHAEILRQLQEQGVIETFEAAALRL